MARFNSQIRTLAIYLRDCLGCVDLCADHSGINFTNFGGSSPPKSHLDFALLLPRPLGTEKSIIKWTFGNIQNGGFIAQKFLYRGPP